MRDATRCERCGLLLPCEPLGCAEARLSSAKARIAELERERAIDAKSIRDLREMLDATERQLEAVLRIPTEKARVEAEARAAAAERERDEARFRPGLGDNHHNAARCPYCLDGTKSDRERAAAAEAEVGELRKAARELNEAEFACGFYADIASEHYPRLIAARKALDRLLAGGEGCVHDRKDARNTVIESGEWCPKCKAVRSGPDAPAASPKEPR